MDYIVILAGGAGKRLWPLSRNGKPKQFHKITSSKTLLQETYERVKLLMGDNRIFISTVPGYAEEIKKELPQIPKENYIIEPVSRGTAPAFAYIALVLKRINPRATIATISSDHHVKDPKAFAKAAKAAFQAANRYPDKLIAVGTNPTKPETVYGYIKMGSQEDEFEKQKVFSIEKFTEKPDFKTAQKYLKNWNCLWNCCYFFFKTSSLLKWIKKYRPKMYKKIAAIDKLIDDPSREAKEKIAELYSQIEEEQIDTAVAEQGDLKKLVVPADLGWSDVGNWGILHDVLKEESSSSIVTRGNHIDFGSEDCLIYGGEKMIATVGLKDMIIVDTPETLLIAKKSRSPEIKKITEKLTNEGKHLYL
ncbi:MAG: sugar phosphate nucleotidyltransferase [Candidatus Berkelbacteria bacterium]|nr:sugar phosphate nucleotidyltransferase [Candidatus Berkelbacteria bacterium]